MCQSKILKLCSVNTLLFRVDSYIQLLTGELVNLATQASYEEQAKLRLHTQTEPYLYTVVFFKFQLFTYTSATTYCWNLCYM